MAREGTEAVVAHLPMCDIHKYDKGVANVPALYDARTIRGPWAFMCQECWEANSPDRELGIGKGQKLVLKDG